MSIFNDENKVKSQWVKFIKIGDKVEGTFISKKIVFNKLSNKDQIVYELKKDNGESWLVGGKYGIDIQMKNIRLGQIVGFEFTESRKSKELGKDPTKIIQVYANSDIVDEKWMEEKKEQKEEEAEVSTDNNSSDNEDIQSVDDISEEEVEGMFDSKGKKKDADDADDDEEDEEDEEGEGWVSKDTDADGELQKIVELAKEKLGAKNPLDAKTKVMEATNLAFITSNFEKIIKALEEMPKKK